MLRTLRALVRNDMGRFYKMDEKVCLRGYNIGKRRRMPEMHEVSLAVDLIEQIENIVSEQQEKGEQVNRVETITLELGKMSHVVADSFRFAFEAVSEGELFAETEIIIRSVPVKIKCAACGEKFEIEPGVLCCPDCGSSQTEILQGRDFIFKSIELR
ncbi:MAG: hydrogenase maturation nickel metallochaperone HypA [bacterium]